MLPAYHLGITLNVVTIVDDIFSPMGGFVCQTDPNDLVCGGQDGYGQLFCGSALLTEEDGWRPDKPTFVFIGEPVTNLVTCGLVAFGTTGVVRHL